MEPRIDGDLEGAGAAVAAVDAVVEEAVAGDLVGLGEVRHPDGAGQGGGVGGLLEVAGPGVERGEVDPEVSEGHQREQAQRGHDDRDAPLATELVLVVWSCSSACSWSTVDVRLDPVDRDLGDRHVVEERARLGPMGGPHPHPDVVGGSASRSLRVVGTQKSPAAPRSVGIVPCNVAPGTCCTSCTPTWLVDPTGLMHPAGTPPLASVGLKMITRSNRSSCSWGNDDFNDCNTERSASGSSPLDAAIRAAVDVDPSTRLLVTHASPISAVPNANNNNNGNTNTNSTIVAPRSDHPDPAAS